MRFVDHIYVELDAVTVASRCPPIASRLFGLRPSKPVGGRCVLPVVIRKRDMKQAARSELLKHANLAHFCVVLSEARKLLLLLLSACHLNSEKSTIASASYRRSHQHLRRRLLFIPLLPAHISPPPPPPLRPPRPPLLLPLTPPFLPLLPFLLLVLSSTFSAARSDSVCGAWGGQYEGLQITTRRTHCGLPGWPVPREGFSAAGSSDISAPSFVRYLRGYRRRFDLDVSFETEVIWAERESVPTQGPGGTPVAGCIRVQFRRCVMDAPLFIRGGVHARLGWSALFDCVGVWRRR